MNGIVLGLTMLVYSTGVAPAVETSRPTIVPAAFTFDLSDAAATSRNLPHRLLNEESRRRWQRGSLQSARAATVQRFTKVDRIIAVAAGACGGWMAGGAIGWVATSKPNDDVSGLRGVIIGAPIGAVIGAVIGYRLTR